MPLNQAAYLLSPKAKTLTVQEAPYPSINSDEIILQTAAVAINPMEWKIQDYNPPIGGKTLQYPLLMGSDVAGTIVQVGTDVTTRKVGQRVILNAHGIATSIAAQGGFQHFVVAGATHTLPIPDTILFEQAVVLPLAFDTAAAGLFGLDQLNLSLTRLKASFPSPQPPPSPEPHGVLLIWGASSSVGCSAIQLARSAGYTVFATASTRNHALCLSLGAAKVFDYSAPDVESRIVTALAESNAPIAGALDCIAEKDTTMRACARILSEASSSVSARAKGLLEELKLVTVLSPPEEALAENVQAIRLMIPSFVRSDGYGITRVWMARALADGELQCRPEAQVVGKGLESVQVGIDMLRKGVSARKLVVLIEATGEEVGS